jgi:cephalosporin hydroxylase
MKLLIDTDSGMLECSDAEGVRKLPLYSPLAFELISQLWVKVGWNEKYPYSFTWLGRPIIQLPEDMIRTQEVIFEVKPDVIIETGVAHGGSLIFYASLCQLLGKGRVIGIDIEIRPHNRQAVEAHPQSERITLMEGSSTAPDIVNLVHDQVKAGETVIVFLDSNHTRDHVAAELEAYCDLVTPGSYIVATDGLMRELHDVPRGRTEWVEDNPVAAAEAFAETHTEFLLDEPARLFDESSIPTNVTHWPSAWLRRI